MEKLGKRFNPLNMVKASWKHGSFVYVFAFMFIIYLIMLPAIRIGSIMNILTHTAVVGTIALGMGLIIISGEIDLSVGSTFAFSGGLGILAYNQILSTTGNHSLAMFVTLIVIVVLSAIIGFINGIMVGKMKMPAFIATLGTMLIFRSLCKFILKAIPTSNGQQQQTYQVDMYYDSPFYTLGNGKLGVVPIVGIILIILTLIVFYFAKYTKFGRKIFALGSNAKAASLAGINVPWTKTIIFTIAGVLVGIAAFLHVGIYSSMDSSTAGMSYELYAIASCVIGGIAMTGGKGNIIGILFGAMSFQIIDKIISAANLNPLINDTIKGAILLLAVILQIIVIDKASVVKYLQNIGLMFNVNKAQQLEGTLRKKVNSVKLAYDKKFQNILKNEKITKEEADKLINKLLDEREAKIVELNKIYNLKIDNAEISTKAYLREKEIKNTIRNNKDEVRSLLNENKLAIKNTKKENPCLVRNLLELEKEQTNTYIDKLIEVENGNYAWTSNVDVLRDNANHILERDREIDEAKATATYEACVAKIDSELAKETSRHENLINKLEAEKLEKLNSIQARIEANIPNEEAQKVQNEEALAKLKAKQDAKDSKKATRLESKNAKLEKERQKAEEAKRRQDYLDSIYAKRGMH